MFANDSQRLVQIADTGVRNNENVAFVRTDQRLAAEAAMRKPEVTKTRQQLVGEAYGNAYLKEQAAKDEARRLEKARVEAEAILRGDFRVLPDGLRIMRANSTARWEVVQDY